MVGKYFQDLSLAASMESGSPDLVVTQANLKSAIHHPSRLHLQRLHMTFIRQFYTTSSKCAKTEEMLHYGGHNHRYSVPCCF